MKDIKGKGEEEDDQERADDPLSSSVTSEGPWHDDASRAVAKILHGKCCHGLFQIDRFLHGDPFFTIIVHRLDHGHGHEGVLGQGELIWYQ